jgi:hypothetical protein
MMTVQVNNMNYRYSSGEMTGAQVFYQARITNENQEFSGTGNVDISKEEYETNFRLSDLQELIKQKIVADIQNTGEEETPTEEPTE